MKLLSVMCLFLVALAYGQGVTRTVAPNSLDFNLYQNQGASINDESALGYSGTAFLNKELTQARLIVNGGNTQVFFMRYNILEDRMEFSPKKNISNLKAMPKSSDIVINLQGKRFQFLNASLKNNNRSGYYEIIHAYDENTLLVIKHKKSILEREGSQSSMYSMKTRSTLKDSKELFLFEDNNLTELSNNKKRLLKILPKEYKKALSTFIKDNKIKFNDDYRGLTATIKQYLALK
ncbi:MAG: hypothetical protein WBA16_00660 [Nonlabens sp.]